VSLPSEDVLSRLRDLESKGYAEAVLTGINLSRYADSSGTDFPRLLRTLLEGTERIAIRISSTEPDAVNEAFAESVSHPRVRPHFHLSVQSGSDDVLRRMRRRYLSSQVFRAADLLRRAKGDAFLACDIIAGFPGETDADFERSYGLCRDIGIAWIHAFPSLRARGRKLPIWTGRCRSAYPDSVWTG
jgi:threonylcarbamoyladenosine tRNA methylthiotransferase MtaB